jgi:hypothetical protein
MNFKTTFTAAVTALTLGGAALATSAPAEAAWGRNRAFAIGAIGGFALCALAASSYHPAYAAPVYAVGGCYIVKRRYVNAWGDLVIRRVQVCE